MYPVFHVLEHLYCQICSLSWANGDLTLFFFWLIPKLPIIFKKRSVHVTAVANPEGNWRLIFSVSGRCFAPLGSSFPYCLRSYLLVQ